jgi:hypothetical protein
MDTSLTSREVGEGGVETEKEGEGEKREKITYRV